MSKTTTTTTSYTSNAIANGTTVSSEGLIKNGTTVRRCLVNGTDVIHKFTRTVIVANSNLTFTITVRFTVRASTTCGYTWYVFDSPIYMDVKVTDNGSSGFTSITVTTSGITFYCADGDSGVSGEYYYRQQLSNQSFTIGQTKTLTFSYFNSKSILDEKDGYSQDVLYVAYLSPITDPDGVGPQGISITSDIIAHSQLAPSYSKTHTATRVVSGRVLSDTTVQEY